MVYFYIYYAFPFYGDGFSFLSSDILPIFTIDFCELFRLESMYFSIASFVSKNRAAVKMTCPSYLCNMCFLNGWKRIIKNKHTNNRTKVLRVSTK